MNQANPTEANPTEANPTEANPTEANPTNPTPTNPTPTKVILVNGSPNERGCTYTALKEVDKVLQEEGIETEIFWIGNKAISGCIGCKKCVEKKKCVISTESDRVNEFVEKAEKADGFVFGSPVHYAGASGAITSFMDRAFYSAGARETKVFRLKAAAAVVSARRGGTTAALDQMNKHFTISEMIVIGSQYWNMVHGNTPEQVAQDLEGLQTMRALGRNMAWFLRCKEAGVACGVPAPKQEGKIRTNFIR